MPDLTDDWLNNIAARINEKRRAANHVYTWEQVRELYTGQPEDVLKLGFDAGKFTNTSDTLVCYEAYLDGWLDAYWKAQSKKAQCKDKAGYVS